MVEIKEQIETMESYGAGSTDKFVESYEAFTQVVSKLQRKYLELKEESGRQAKLLEEANSSLQKMSLRNRAVTEFLNSVFGSVAAGIVVINRSGKITHLNGFAERLFSISSSEKLGSDYAETLPQLTPETPSALTAITDNPGWRRSPHTERCEYSPDGNGRVFLTSATQMRNESGEVFGAVEVFHDITDIKQMEREVSRMEGLASIGRMAATVAHQIRNPLVSVKGFASLLARDIKRDDENHARAEKILRGVENLERVIEALLSFSRQERLSRRPTNMNRYIKKVVRQFNEKLGDAESRFVKYVGPETKLEVELDQLVFREALENILHNAVESSRRSVSVRVTLSKDQEEGAIINLTINDNGPGMNSETLDKIFSPFYTTKADGAGLGLPLARKLVRAHKGEIKVESTPGRGSTFFITLPEFQKSQRTGENNRQSEQSNSVSMKS